MMNVLVSWVKEQKNPSMEIQISKEMANKCEELGVALDMLVVVNSDLHKLTDEQAD